MLTLPGLPKFIKKNMTSNPHLCLIKYLQLNECINRSEYVFLYSSGHPGVSSDAENVFGFYLNLCNVTNQAYFFCITASCGCLQEGKLQIMNKEHQEGKNTHNSL